MAKHKKGRDIHGIVLLDKRLGISSNKALQEVKRLYQANKAGHTGSLDPLASGLLPICLGEATKVSGMLLEHDKRYIVDIQLGVMTSTGDAEGDIIQTSAVPELTEADIETCLQRFLGTTTQVPPMYSALKLQGKKLYELAREGISVEREARTINISQLILKGYNAAKLSLDVTCSKGTYIRSLAQDVGFALGTCATVTMLRRIGVGHFAIEQSKTLDELATLDDFGLFQQLIPVDHPLQKLPSVQLNEEQARQIRFGQAVNYQTSHSGMIRLYHDATFLGLGESLLDAKIAPKKLFNMNNV